MNINQSVESAKQDLLLEANLNVNLRRMVYDYFKKDPDKKRMQARRRRISKIEGFADAKKKFMNKPKKSRDMFVVKDALSYIKKHGTSKKKFDRKIFEYNKTQVVRGIQEIKKILNSKSSPKQKHLKIEKIIGRIRNYHVFFPGRLTEKDYVGAWKDAYLKSNGENSFDGKKFSNAQRTMMSGVSYF